MPRDALDVAIDELMRSAASRGQSSWDANIRQKARERTAAARASVRKAVQEMGEVYTVTGMHNQSGIRVRVVKVPPQEFSVGDRVRITKIEGGTHG